MYLEITAWSCCITLKDNCGFLTCTFKNRYIQQQMITRVVLPSSTMLRDQSIPNFHVSYCSSYPNAAMTAEYWLSWATAVSSNFCMSLSRAILASTLALSIPSSDFSSSSLSDLSASPLGIPTEEMQQTEQKGLTIV